MKTAFHTQYVHLISVAGMFVLTAISIAPLVGAFTKGMTL